MKETPTKTEFEKYERIRESGKYNTATDAARVRRKTRRTIVENRSRLKKKFFGENSTEKRHD